MMRNPSNSLIVSPGLNPAGRKAVNIKPKASFLSRLTPLAKDAIACIITVPAALIVCIAVLMIIAEAVKATAP